MTQSGHSRFTIAAVQLDSPIAPGGVKLITVFPRTAYPSNPAAAPLLDEQYSIASRFTSLTS
jgi:hypothetical protein